MSGLKSPMLLKIHSDNISDVWNEFKRAFSWYLITMNLKLKPEVKVAMFMSTIGHEAINIFNTFKS